MSDLFITFAMCYKYILSSMLSLLIKIIAYGVLIFSVLGAVLYMIDFIRYAFSKKGSGPLPWWVFWRP